MIITATILEITGRAEYQIPIPDNNILLKPKKPKTPSQFSALYQFKRNSQQIEPLERVKKQAKNKARYFSKARLAELDETTFKKGMQVFGKIEFCDILFCFNVIFRNFSILDHFYRKRVVFTHSYN